jgi:hypothetical protein
MTNSCVGMQEKNQDSGISWPAVNRVDVYDWLIRIIAV